jgi:hypothetical protein
LIVLVPTSGPMRSSADLDQKTSAICHFSATLQKPTVAFAARNFRVKSRTI